MDASKELAQIGAVAEELGVSPRTIKYYEEIGLVEPEERTPGGFRLYGEGDIRRLTGILKMKAMGFSLSAIRELLSARDEAREAAKTTVLSTAIERLSERRGEVGTRIGKLEEDLESARSFEREIACDIELCRKRMEEIEADE
ncbi:MAG: MerR family transcriptional regulator [Actinomycetota bacterium]|jgi:DNA-binding transcriptional MerR regulator|nr:MerR family transcriptional regulator [Actinomycetota bacterium]